LSDNKKINSNFIKIIIFYVIIIGLMIPSLILINLIQILGAFEMNFEFILGVILIVGVGIVVPIIVIALNLVGIFIYPKVSANFDYLPLIIGIINVSISIIIALIAFIRGPFTIIEGFTPERILLLGYYITVGVLILIAGAVSVITIFFSIRIIKWEK